MGGGRASRSTQTAKASGPLTVSAEQLQELQHRIHERKLEEADYRLMEAILETVVALRNAVQQKSIAVKRLLRIVFGPRSEKTRSVLPQRPPEPCGSEPVKLKLEPETDREAARPRPQRGRAVLGGLPAGDQPSESEIRGSLPAVPEGQSLRDPPSRGAPPFPGQPPGDGHRLRV